MKSYKNLWEIAVLALLREASMHPYQMQRLLKERHKDELLELKRGSLYHAINRLMAAGLIEATNTARSGRRPERTIYRITAEGRQELIQTLQQMIELPRHESSEFMAALSFLLHLEHKDAIEKLEERAQHVEEELNASANRLKEAQQRVDRINLIESEYLLAMRRAELKWIRSLIPELRSKDLHWDMKKIFRNAKESRITAAAAKEK
jgi:DNA-binding PadR family transcriptional regulator